jgi:RNA recognition motif-containing protein
MSFAIFRGIPAMSNLLLINVPYNASDREIREWIESRGIGTKSIRIVRDLVTGASPSFGHVELKSSTPLKEAISILDGKRMRSQTIRAKADPAYA